MLEILIMIAVVKAFVKQAKDKNLNKNLWGFIGAASYYIPVLVMGLLILPQLVLNGFIDVASEGSYMVMAVIVNLFTGAFCCMIAYGVLYNMKPHVEVIKTDDAILDDEFYAREVVRGEG